MILWAESLPRLVPRGEVLQGTVRAQLLDTDQELSERGAAGLILGC